MKSPYPLICILVSLIHLCIGASVFLKAPRNRTNQTFFLAIVGLALWMLLNTGSVIYWRQIDTRTIFTRLAYGGGIFATGTIAVFCILFSSRVSVPRKSIVFISLICALFLVLAFIPGAIFRGYRIEGSNIVELHGPFRIPFYVTEAVLFAYGLWRLWKRYETSPFVEERYQIKLLSTGIVIPFFITLCGLVVLPYFIGRSPLLSCIGPMSTFGFILLAGYATLRQGYFLDFDLALECVFNSISGGICVTQTDGRIIRYNTKLVEILEYEGEPAGRE